MVNAAETEPVMLGSMLGPDEGDMDDFDDYDFGDQEPPVIVDLSNNQEDTTETDDNNDFMDEEPVSTFDKLYMFIGLFIILFQRQYLSEVAAEILMAFINIILSYTNTSCLKLPKKLSILRQHMGVDIFEEGLKRYVACKKCHKIYTLDVLLANEQTLCHHIEYPHHPSSAWSAKLCFPPSRMALPIVAVPFICLFSIYHVPKETYQEPSNHQMNHYMEPLVKELEKLYEGVPVSNDPNSPTMRALLLSVNCDIPAARKVGAFTGIQSFCACYWCDRKFTQLPGSTLRNWGGFDFAWQDRDEAKNAEGAEKWKAARTPQEWERIENKYGTRWSPLCRLKYFQRSRQRRMVNPTTGKPLLTKDHFAEMQREAELIKLPPGFDISKTKIGGHFAFMKGIYLFHPG
ncbi:hypothetical protein INT45_009692 [Circinella minor]|uniref:Uncharacterized protein n=1 Tax=Circinella minor TaxID=1195481 RepID=A0A8H7RC92_9FUNG|nr:hypothetical protein INT45_009692 [Circinella minor]